VHVLEKAPASTEVGAGIQWALTRLARAPFWACSRGDRLGVLPLRLVLAVAVDGRNSRSWTSRILRSLTATPTSSHARGDALHTLLRAGRRDRVSLKDRRGSTRSSTTEAG
jgi:hypothetical protein